MKIITMRSRNPLVVGLTIVVVLGALSLAFMLGVILLSTLAIAGALIGAGLVIRNKLTRGSSSHLERTSVRAQLDPSKEVHPDRGILPPPDRRTLKP